MTTIASFIILARGWRRHALAAAAGAAGALAMPPIGMLPALALSLTVAVWLLDGCALASARPTPKALKSAALAGWCWGFGYFVAGLWWLGAAFLVEADQFAWALPFGVLGLPAGLAFFTSFGFALARCLWAPGIPRLFALAAALSMSEWLRGHLFTGFPWNAFGMALGQHLWLMQAASLAGLYGLTLVAILIGAAPAVLGTGRTARERWLAPGAAGAGLAALALYGALRLPSAPTPLVEGVRLRIMQPNLPQDAKFSVRNREAILQRYLAITDRVSADGSGLAATTHVFWPESAFPFLLERDPQALAQIAGLLPPGVTLVTGAARMDDPLPGETVGRFFNAVQVIGADGRIGATYDKVHLVPFGEYIPAFLDGLIRAVGLHQFVHVPGGFDASGQRRVLSVPGLAPAAATICYEAIFPSEVLPEGDRPALILNLTNDAWFGDTPGPRQHFAQARLRSVEEGLPLVRAANTGISAVVDPYGVLLASLPVGTDGVLDAGLPSPIPNTVYGIFRDRIFLVLVLSCFAVPVLARQRQRRPVLAPGVWTRART